MNRMDILFVDHVNKLKTSENTVMIEAVMNGFMAILESNDEIVPDHELVNMSDDEANEKLNQIVAALKKMRTASNATEIDNYLRKAHKRLFDYRKHIQSSNEELHPELA